MLFLPRLARFCLKLRYEVSIEGEELLKKYKDTSILCLANHPALIDPVIVLSFLEPYLELQPLAAEKFFKNSFIHFFLKKLHALAVPEFETGNNEYKAWKVKILTKKLEEELEHKAKILLYPAGHLSDSQTEKLGGAALAYDLKKSPRKMIGIATSGLYGSLFSRYWTGQTPSFFDILLKGMKIVLKNGIFHVPKRKVRIKLFEFDESIQNISDKKSFNQAVEKAFSQNMISSPVVVSYGRSLMPSVLSKPQVNHHNVDEKIKTELLKIAEHVLKRPVKLDSHLSYDLGMDSLELAEILTLVEQRYHVRIDHFPETLLELGSLIESHEAYQKPDIVYSKKRKLYPIEVPPECQNVLEAFYKQAALCPSRRMAQDQTLKEVSYKKAVLIVELLAKKLKKHEKQYIGITLPSSIMAYLLMLACLRARKTPVMLNWTGGYSSLDFAIKLLDLSWILSSEKFLEKVYNFDLREHFDTICPLEDLKKQISVFDKILGLTSTYFPNFLAKKARDKAFIEDEAVILFTSGSESMPKAVPLTHGNILANIDGLLSTDLVLASDRFLATLPPFHSFGCVVSGFLPLIAGLDTIYMPDPTDALSLAAAIGLSKATLFCSAPSFLKQILIYAEDNQLNSLRLVVVGAEKLQDSVRELFSQKCINALLLEGYGITECSPVVTIQRNPLTKGVGIPLKNVELKIVDPDSGTPLGLNRVGEIVIHGKSVFKGYLGIKKDPFIEIDNQRWYRSGDRGSLTEKKELILEGRFKRFIKISAEMISLGAIEEALDDLREAPEGKAQFAVVAAKGSDQMILVTIHEDVSLDEINQHLRSKGCPKVAKISKIIRKTEIPQLATGKIDYRSLDHEII